MGRQHALRCTVACRMGLSQWAQGAQRRCGDGELLEIVLPLFRGPLVHQIRAEVARRRHDEHKRRADPKRAVPACISIALLAALFTACGVRAHRSGLTMLAEKNGPLCGLKAAIIRSLTSSVSTSTNCGAIDSVLGFGFGPNRRAAALRCAAAA